MRTKSWSTVVAKRDKLRSKVSAATAATSELETIEAELASMVTSETIEKATAKLLKLRRDEQRAVATLIGLVGEARSGEVEVPEDSAAIVDELAAAEKTTVEVEVETETVSAGLSPDEIED